MYLLTSRMNCKSTNSAQRHYPSQTSDLLTEELPFQLQQLGRPKMGGIYTRLSWSGSMTWTRLYAPSIEYLPTELALL